MKKILFLVLPVLFACQSNRPANYPYSEKETKEFLDQISSNVMALNSDRTLIHKKPADEFDLLTYYPLAKSKVEEYNKNGHIVNKMDDIADFATYEIKDYELINEKNEKLQLKDNNSVMPLQDFSLWTYNDVLCGQLGVYVKLHKNFETLKGHITVLFAMPGNQNRNVKIPVNISITDEDPRPGI
ncbi:hypothetical protein ACR79M_01535 [Sphingobacterium spiritivorum]|uniref:hypothetical protein n=1 Tax=Sphingobacterium spiritivorum TaxID=258 RepID=UPI003DA38EBC